MAKTPVTASLRWLGDRFDVSAGGDMPAILVQALGAGAIAFDGENLGVTTSGGPVNIGPGDWLITTEADGLGAVTDADFNANYEVQA
jgi:hypothetical protein